jgi:pimeloyl-ACP methyl ester carboxylesterase
MPWQIVTSYTDYASQMRRLLQDPLFRGGGVPRGNGEPVLVVPGFLAGDWSLKVMTRWLDRLGYRVYSSGIDWNVMCPQRTSELLRRRLEQVVKEVQRPVTIIGHSLGGVLARYLGASLPRHVRQVIALGSPIDGSMRIHPLVPLTFKMIQRVQGFSARPMPPCAKDVRCTCEFVKSAFGSLPLDVPFAAIYSRQDEIVDWRACIDPAKSSYEVQGQHLGLIVNPAVYRLLGQLLSAGPVAPEVTSSESRRPRPRQRPVDVPAAA